MRLFPRIDDSPALRELAASLSGAGVERCRQQRGHWHHGAWYGPAGGDQVGPDQLKELAEALSKVAEAHGYPEPLRRETKAIDIDMSIALFGHMGITPVEATAGGIWNFLACVVVPDLVAWRWPVKEEQVAGTGQLDRWLVGRRWYRHALGRLWWRACMFGDPATPDRWHLMRQLQEDEFIQLLERPHLVGHRDAVLALMAAMVATFKAHPELNRGELMRIAAKRLLRLGAVVDLDAFDAPGLSGLMQEIATGAVTSLERTHGKTAHA